MLPRTVRTIASVPLIHVMRVTKEDSTTNLAARVSDLETEDEGNEEAKSLIHQISELDPAN